MGFIQLCNAFDVMLSSDELTTKMAYASPLPRFRPTPYDPQNIFAKIVRGEIPSFKVMETDTAIAILDAFPCTRGHCLLLPKDSGGSPDVTHMPPAAAVSFLSALPAVCSAVAQGIPGCDGVTVIQNNGASAGQLVQHPHFHITRTTWHQIVPRGVFICDRMH